MTKREIVGFLILSPFYFRLTLEQRKNLVKHFVVAEELKEYLGLKK